MYVSNVCSTSHERVVFAVVDQAADGRVGYLNREPRTVTS